MTYCVCCACRRAYDRDGLCIVCGLSFDARVWLSRRALSDVAVTSLVKRMKALGIDLRTVRADVCAAVWASMKDEMTPTGRRSAVKPNLQNIPPPKGEAQ